MKVAIYAPIPDPGLIRRAIIILQRVVGYPGAGMAFTEGCLCGYRRVDGRAPMVDRCQHCHPGEPGVVDFDL